VTFAAIAVIQNVNDKWKVKAENQRLQISKSLSPKVSATGFSTFNQPLFLGSHILVKLDRVKPK